MVKVKKERNFKLEKQEILPGSRIIKTKNTKNRIDYFIENIEDNYSFKHTNLFKNKSDLINEFKIYREKWNDQPNTIIKKYKNTKSIKNNLITENILPLCIDLEVASICDLACPHCFREYLATPDKIIDLNFAKKTIKEASINGVKSIKFNWRGEPLLNPNLTDLIKYAKDVGIIETIINTNATNLTEKKSLDLINSGLDYMIYSFDGGSKKTYETLRPGRFKKNNFEQIIKNIRKFKSIRDQTNSKFPYTKIQMVLMESNRHEVESFKELFDDYVDEVTVTLYSERGGSLNDLPVDKKNKLENYLFEKNLPKNTPYMLDGEGNLFISLRRKTCKQIFQRLMVTYDGKVGMCCLDWGAKHNLGYLSNKGFSSKMEEKKIINNIKMKKKGFELLKDAKLPKTYNEPEKKILSIKEIWNGLELNKVRDMHLNDKINDIEVCKNCNSKDTFVWEKIN